jgi:penicillin amidase
MGSVSLLRPFFNRGPYEADGSGVTAGAMGFSATGSFAVESAAPWRFVADLSDLAHCYDVVAIGVSGQPFSSHYSDQMSMWLGGQYKEMLFDRAEIEALDGLEVTVLTPGP